MAPGVPPARLICASKALQDFQAAVAAAGCGGKTGAGAPLPSSSFPLLNSDWGLGSPGIAGRGKGGKNGTGIFGI